MLGQLSETADGVHEKKNWILQARKGPRPPGREEIQKGGRAREVVDFGNPAVWSEKEEQSDKRDDQAKEPERLNEL